MQITDLGLAKRIKADGLPSASNSPARMQGTFGYFAPEYAIVGRASLKSDVFSFGVVLLELITGRKPIHRLTNKLEESLVIWVRYYIQTHIYCPTWSLTCIHGSNMAVEKFCECISFENCNRCRDSFDFPTIFFSF